MERCLMHGGVIAFDKILCFRLLQYQFEKVKEAFIHVKLSMYTNSSCINLFNQLQKMIKCSQYGLFLLSHPPH